MSIFFIDRLWSTPNIITALDDTAMFRRRLGKDTDFGADRGPGGGQAEPGELDFGDPAQSGLLAVVGA